MLADFELERGATRRYPERVDEATLPRFETQAQRADGAARRAHACRRAEVQRWLARPQRTTYLLDVRTPEEFARRLAARRGARARRAARAGDGPVGGVRNARIVLIDSEGVRAPVVASWLKQLGCDVVRARRTASRAQVRSAARRDACAARTCRRSRARELKHALDADAAACSIWGRA